MSGVLGDDFFYIRCSGKASQRKQHLSLNKDLGKTILGEYLLFGSLLDVSEEQQVDQDDCRALSEEKSLAGAEM